TAGSGANHAVADDFNGDGKADLVVANASSTYFTILRNAGLCSANCNLMTGPVNYAAGTTPRSVAVGDLNGDGKPDLAVANNGSNNLSILLGNGNGTFQTAVNYGAGSGPEAVAVGDFNRDGKADLVVANSGATTVSILAGNGDG